MQQEKKKKKFLHKIKSAAEKIINFKPNQKLIKSLQQVKSTLKNTFESKF